MNQAAQLNAQIDDLHVQIKHKDQRINLLEEMVRTLKQKQFGASSEKESSPQLNLFNEAEADQEEALKAEAEEVTVPEHTRKKKKRVSIPEDLPREEIVYDLTESEKLCPQDGTELKCIGEESSEQLDIEPAKIKVLRHLRKKYACPCCEEYFITAQKPAQPIEKSIAAPGLLAYVATNKYCDGLPLYRQINGFKRIGVELDRTTLANWMIKVGQLTQPLINRLQEIACEQNVLHMDETPLQVLNEPNKTAQSQSYMWVMASAQHASQSVILYHYSPSRSGETPKQWLADFQGTLMTDGYEGYASVCTENNLTRLGCWAHARRKFMEAKRQQAKGKSGKSDQALALIQKLYRVEQLAQEKTEDERQLIRQTQAQPIIDKLRQWLDKTQATTPPKTTLGKALSYLNNQWIRLTRYQENGAWPIDNNRAENAIRPFVIGRKNWLFSSSQAGAHASANLYSLIETAKANGLEPYAYLKQLFTLLPQATSLEDVDQLLPCNVKGGVG